MTKSEVDELDLLNGGCVVEFHVNLIDGELFDTRVWGYIYQQHDFPDVLGLAPGSILMASCCVVKEKRRSS